jgi:hypothetical protein
MMVSSSWRLSGVTLTESNSLRVASPRVALQAHAARAIFTCPAAFAAQPNISRPGARPFSTAKPVTPIKAPKRRPQGYEMSQATTLKVACLQLACGADKQKNIDNAAAKIEEAARAGAELVVLPECFNSPYGTKYFPEYAESVIDGNSATCEMLSKAAREGGVFLVGGSFPEREGDKLYNTCYVFNKEGDMLARHRKIHLFDIDIPGKITFKESETLSPGEGPTVVDLSEHGGPPVRTKLCVLYGSQWKLRIVYYINNNLRLNNNFTGAHGHRHLLRYPFRGTRDHLSPARLQPVSIPRGLQHGYRSRIYYIYIYIYIYAVAEVA